MGVLEAIHGPTGNGPARYYRLPGATGTVGFIGALTDHFCQTCNRLRLTADGRLRPCLMSEHEIDLQSLLSSGVGPDGIRRAIAEAILLKPERHHLAEAQRPLDRTMSQIGG
jgi:cyclic pyranopterin phosphate synthase